MLTSLVRLATSCHRSTLVRTTIDSRMGSGRAYREVSSDMDSASRNTIGNSSFEICISGCLVCLPCTIHVEVITALQRDGASTSNLLVPYSTSQRDLARHGSTTDDRLVQSKFLHQSGNTTHIGVLVVGVLSRPITDIMVSQVLIFRCGRVSLPFIWE